VIFTVRTGVILLGVLSDFNREQFALVKKKILKEKDLRHDTLLYYVE